VHGPKRVRSQRRRLDTSRWLQGARRALLTSETFPTVASTSDMPPKQRGESKGHTGDQWKVLLIVVTAGAGPSSACACTRCCLCRAWHLTLDASQAVFGLPLALRPRHSLCLPSNQRFLCSSSEFSTLSGLCQDFPVANEWRYSLALCRLNRLGSGFFFFDSPADAKTSHERVPQGASLISRKCPGASLVCLGPSLVLRIVESSLSCAALRYGTIRGACVGTRADQNITLPELGRG
jgi:hypothetical protein